MYPLGPSPEFFQDLPLAYDDQAASIILRTLFVKKRTPTSTKHLHLCLSSSLIRKPRIGNGKCPSDHRSYCGLLLAPIPKSAAAPSRQALALLAGGNDGMVPRGYVPMVLVGDDEGGSEERRIMVRVEMLKEPCMAAVLEMAAQQFGYGQRGVLRIPCGADRFQQMVGRRAPLHR
nr:uncharacterized protein LOC117835366 [Setaria viridis]